MRDPYLYEGTRVLKNKLGITSQEELDRAEADYVSWRLKQLAMNPLPGAYTTQLFLDMHKFIFQDLYDWAGCIREINIEKEEPALGGLSIEYADISTIRKDLNSAIGSMNRRDWMHMDLEQQTKWFSHDFAALWKVHAFREGNTRTAITFCCQFADDHGFPLDRTLFEENSLYVRTSLVAYNAVFHDLGDRSQKQHLELIIQDSIERSNLRKMKR